MQKILICSDKYKGTLTSAEVNQAVKSGIEEARYPALCDLVSMSDGGDGFISVIHDLETLYFDTVNALNQPIKAEIGYRNGIVYLEIAKIIGLAMLNDKGSIWERSSFGLGCLITNILDSSLKVSKIVIGGGGSSTSDGGFGCLIGLGAKFYDNNNNILKPAADQMLNIEHIDLTTLHSKLKEVSIDIVADVKGSLLGQNGCTYQFATQKGAMPADLPKLEQSLSKLQQVLLKTCAVDINECIYGLCSGGLTAGLSILPGITYYDGAVWVIKHTNLELKIAYCDIVVSGEGMLDHTTLHGKLVWHIARLCKKQQKPLIIIAGQINCDFEELKSSGISCAFPIINNCLDKAQKFAGSGKLISQRVKDLFSLGKMLG